jgi:hypothetical protein
MEVTDQAAGVVLMGTKVTSTHRTLCDLVAKQSLPDDDYNHHMPLTSMKFSQSRSTYNHFVDIVDHYLEATVGNRGPFQTKNLKRHWEYILLHLSRGVLLRHWTVVALKKGAYTNDYWLNRYDLSHTYIKLIVEFLQDRGLIELLQGKRYNDKPMRTRIFATPQLAASLLPLALDAEQPIEPPYITINNPEDEWGEVIADLPDDHPALVTMIKINEFLKEHEWACKGPVRAAYKHSPFEGGRLITAFQNLPDKKIRLRINTRIDGKPICEVDFNANHLRLNLADIAGEDAGDTPYEDIMEIAGISERQQVKDFITRAMGSIKRSDALGACHKEGISNKQFEIIEQATLKRYPKLSLFSGFGMHAQNIEGQILKQVMLDGVDKGIVALPVHDAVAVVQGNEGWAEEAMLDAWFKYANSDGSSAKARVKVDYPASPGC